MHVLSAVFLRPHVRRSNTPKTLLPSCVLLHKSLQTHPHAQMAAGRGDEGDADEGIDSQDGGAAAPRGPQSSYSHASIKSFMRDVLTRSQPARAMARLDMVFPRPAGGAGGAGDEQQLKIAVQVWGTAPGRAGGRWG